MKAVKHICTTGIMRKRSVRPVKTAWAICTPVQDFFLAMMCAPYRSFGTLTRRAAKRMPQVMRPRTTASMEAAAMLAESVNSV